MNRLKSTYSVLKNLARRQLDQGLFFMHIPKCGGTSVKDAVVATYDTAQIDLNPHMVRLDNHASLKVVGILNGFPGDYAESEDLSAYAEQIRRFRETEVLYFMSKKSVRFITGHCPFSNLAYDRYHERFRFVTILRDPYEMFLSNYFYNRFKKAKHRRIDKDLEEFLTSERARHLGSIFVQLLCGDFSCPAVPDSETIELAKENVKKFDIVGSINYPDHFVSSFKRLFGVTLRLPHKRKSPVSKKKRMQMIDPSIEAKIRQLNKPNSELYRFVVDHLIRPNNKKPEST